MNNKILKFKNSNKISESFINLLCHEKMWKKTLACVKKIRLIAIKGDNHAKFSDLSPVFSTVKELKGIQPHQKKTFENFGIHMT